MAEAMKNRHRYRPKEMLQNREDDGADTGKKAEFLHRRHGMNQGGDRDENKQLFGIFKLSTEERLRESSRVCGT